MTLVSLDPMSSLLRLQQDLERFFENPSIDLGFSGRGAFPPLNVFTDADGVVIRAEIPGVKADDLSIEAESGRLTLRGERKSLAPASGSFHRRERPYGTFARSIRLPSDLDFSESHAKYRNGVLTLRIPRAEEAKPRKIQVDAG